MGGLGFLRCFSLVVPSVTLTRKFNEVKYFLTNYYCKGRASKPLTIAFAGSSFTPGGITLVPARVCSNFLSFTRFLLLLCITGRGGTSKRITTYCLVFCDVKEFIVRFFEKSVREKDMKMLSASRFVDVFAAITKVVLLLAIIGGRGRRTGVDLGDGN